jgi:hypothetical protein
MISRYNKSKKLKKHKTNKTKQRSKQSKQSKKSKKHKITKSKKNKYYSRIKKTIGGDFNPLGLIARELPDDTHPSLLPPKFNKYLSFLKTNSNTDKIQPFHIFYNYKYPEQFEINTNKANDIFTDSQISAEPYISTYSPEHYLVVIYNFTKQQMMFIAEYKNHNKYRTILSYKAPKVENNIINTIKIAFVKYNPDTEKSTFTVPDIYATDRNEILQKFFNFLKVNNIDINTIPKVIFNIKNDINAFSISKFISPRSSNSQILKETKPFYKI